jgi:hypothetical protein
MKRLLFIALTFLSLGSSAQKVPQKVNTWYEFWGLSIDSLLQYPRVITRSIYRDTGVAYYNKGDSQVYYHTGRQFRTIYQDYLFNIYTYGATYDSTVDNTAAIQGAINTCHANGGGTVFIPKGIWGVSKLRLQNDVSLLGEALLGTTLKARTADTMIVSWNDSFSFYRGLPRGYNPVSNLFLDGFGIGTVGMALRGVYYFNWSNLSVYNFTSIGIYTKATLEGVFTDLNIFYCPTGFFSDTTMLKPCVGCGTAYVAPNLLLFQSCRFRFASQWGINWNNSQGLGNFVHCEITSNGTAHNELTGGIKISKIQLGCKFQSCNFEDNKGSCVYIDQPSNICTISFDNVQIFSNPLASWGIRFGTTTVKTYILLTGTEIVGDSIDIGFSTLASPPYYNPQQIILIGARYGTSNFPTLRTLTDKDLSIDAITHLIGTTPLPTLVLKNGSGGAGVAGSLASWSNSMTGQILITAGAAPAANDTLAIYQYAGGALWVQNGTAPIIAPGNDNARKLFAKSPIYGANGGGFNYIYLFTGDSALVAGTPYIFNILIPGK